MWCLNGKNPQILIASRSEGRSRFGQKKYSLALEDFAHIFVLFTTPCVMFEWKKTPQILIADQKEGVDLDKKKYS